MVDKLHEYQGVVGQLHAIRDRVKRRWEGWREEHPGTAAEIFKNVVNKNKEQTATADYSHVYRKKTRKELIRLSAAVCGIEFAYAAETAFVTPLLLKIGVQHRFMTMVWGLSPCFGFFATPILGSLSDRCRSSIGRRRPFIMLLSLGVIFGLIVVPNGESIGYGLGDIPFDNTTIADPVFSTEINQKVVTESHLWGMVFTILGVALLDFSADACQSPSRAYLLDVTIPEDHARGLSTFTILAGLGGFFGYSMGALNWDNTFLGQYFGGQVGTVFSLITVIFTCCVIYTLTSFAEIPLDVLEMKPNPAEISNIEEKEIKEEDQKNSDEKYEETSLNNTVINYGSLQNQENEDPEKSRTLHKYKLPPLPTQDLDQSNTGDGALPHHTIDHIPVSEEIPDLKHYIMSILNMPSAVKKVCLTNLFCWMAHVCYSLYFTDFVGESVFGGDPRAPIGSIERTLFEDGVRFGCWGMAIYSLSCACYSTIIEKVIKRFGAKKVYIGGLLTYSLGMAIMAITKHPVGVILFSGTAGVMYSTLFTMPYLLIAHYHSTGTFEVGIDGQPVLSTEIRGLGTDIGIVGSMVFLAQFLLSFLMGSLINITGTTTAVVAVASCLAFCGSITANYILYLDL